MNLSVTFICKEDDQSSRELHDSPLKGFANRIYFDLPSNHDRLSYLIVCLVSFLSFFIRYY